MFRLRDYLRNNFDMVFARACVDLRLCLPEDLPEFAQQAIERGLDGKELRFIAGLSRPTWVDLNDLPKKVFEGLRVPELSKEDSARIIAAGLSKAILQEWVSPYEGANFVWRKLREAVDLDEFLPFVGAASEYEDHPDNEREMAESIKQTAAQYLQRKAYA